MTNIFRQNTSKASPYQPSDALWFVFYSPLSCIHWLLVPQLPLLDDVSIMSCVQTPLCLSALEALLTRLLTLLCSPVSCIHWVTLPQLTLLEDEMRRLERVNVGLMLAGQGHGGQDVFTQAAWRWDKRQARAVVSGTPCCPLALASLTSVPQLVL